MEREIEKRKYKEENRYFYLYDNECWKESIINRVSPKFGY